MTVENKIDEVPVRTTGPKSFGCRNFVGSKDTIVSFERSNFGDEFTEGLYRIVSTKLLNNSDVLFAKSC